MTASFQYRIGAVNIAPATVLAPMEGITDRPFRTLIRSLGGCGLTVTEFVSSESLAKDTAQAWRSAELDPNEHPVAIQIYGRSPERMGDAARMCADLGADVIDLNLGCPSKQVTSGCAGSALMREPERAKAIFDAVGAALDIPFTVKMRLGWDSQSLNAVEIARLAEDAGARQVAVHGRTREDAYSGAADWAAIRAVKDAVAVPVIVNGDILDVATAKQALERSGADGVMVGRGIMRNPWLLLQISQAMRGESVFHPTLRERWEVLQRYLDILGDQYEGKALLGRIKRVTAYLTRGLATGSQVREAVFRCADVTDARERLGEFSASLEEDVFRAIDYEVQDPRLRDGDSRTITAPEAG